MQERTARQAAALRANLQRRKAQLRARRDGTALAVGICDGGGSHPEGDRDQPSDAVAGRLDVR